MLSFWAVLGMALFVAAVLVVLFPRQALIDQVSRTPRNDPLTENYLANLLRTDPHNQELRVLLAEKRYAMGDIGGAHAVLESALGSDDTALRRRAMLLDYRMLSSGGNPSQAELSDPRRLATLRSRLSALATESWPPEDLIFLSGQARRLGLNAVASRLVGRILSEDTHASQDQLKQAGQSALGNGEYALAANFYFAAQGKAKDIDEKRELFLRGVSTLQSGNLLREALQAADAHIGDLKDDEQTLTRLTRLALAANDPARAQRYIKQLMHMSKLELRMGNDAQSFHVTLSPAPLPVGEGFKRFGDRLLGFFISGAYAQSSTSSARATISRPYDETIYNLAYDVFLANGNVADARKVAEAAVAQRPDDIVWREKLAKAAEWSGGSDAALAQWLSIANKTGREDAWQAVLRLAPGVHDDDALLAAWQHEAARRALTPAELSNVARIYENLGRPDDGIRFLEEQFTRRSDPAVLEALAALQERARRSDDAIQSLARLQALRPVDTGLALRLATLLFLRSDFKRAYDVLAALQSRVPAENGEYWKLLADLAWQLQQDATASNAYGQLARGGKAQEPDMVRLVQLLRPRQPEEAQRLALLAWRRFHSVASMLTALEIANDRRDYPRMRQLLDEIAPADEAGLAARPFYFILRASYSQGMVQPRQAMAEYRRALALAPTAPDVRVAYLWMLVDARELPDTRAELRKRLAEWARDAAASSGYWDAYAAGYQTLGEPRRGLPFLARQAAGHRDDFLWLSNYADALDASGEAGMAWRVRRQAWLLAQQRLMQNPALLTQDAGASANNSAAREAMLAYARLATASAPGDTALAAMRLLLRQDQAPATRAEPATTAAAAQRLDAAFDGQRRLDAAFDGQRRLDAASTELVLSWYLGEERYDTAHAWLWTRYARRASAPAWADYTLALAEQDWERLEQLLDLKPASASGPVPPLTRIEAARATGRLGLAQDLGSEALERDPASDELHLRLATDLLASATSVIARDVMFERGVVAGHEQGVRIQVWHTPRLRVALDLAFSFQHSADETQLRGVPGTDRDATLSLLLRHGLEAADGETEISLGRRSGVTDFSTAGLRIARPLGPRLSGSVGLALHQRAYDSVPLQIAGHKDEARLDLHYAPTGREYLNTQAWSARYHTQGGTYVGSGSGAYVEAGYRVRIEYPELSVRLSRTLSHYSAVDAADAASAALTADGSIPPGSFFVPQSFRMWGVNVAIGGDTRETRSRAIRPFADLGRSVNSLSGSGYNWLVGAGGSLIGPDHASIYWLRSKGGGGTNVTVREAGLRYQYFFN